MRIILNRLAAVWLSLISEDVIMYCVFVIHSNNQRFSGGYGREQIVIVAQISLTWFFER